MLRLLGPLLLASVLASAQFTGTNLGCAITGGTVGGYAPVNTSDTTVSTDLTSYAQMAVDEWVDTPAAANLPDCSALSDPDITILQACQQVVAGTNYDMVFATGLNCSTLPAGLHVTLEAVVFVPLPYTNDLPTVNLVQRFNGTTAAQAAASAGLSANSTVQSIVPVLLG